MPIHKRRMAYEPPGKQADEGGAFGPSAKGTKQSKTQKPSTVKDWSPRLTWKKKKAAAAEKKKYNQGQGDPWWRQHNA